MKSTSPTATSLAAAAAATAFAASVFGITLNAAGNPKSAIQNPKSPNIIIFLADDMGYGDSSVNGGWIKTPQMEKLAAEGLRFTDFHASAAVCSPTRVGLLTGRYQQRAGIPNVILAAERFPSHFAGLQQHENTLPKMLGQAGYATALFGKWHLGYYPEYNPMRHGFDVFRGYLSGNVDYHTHQDNQGRDDWWNGLKKKPEKGYTTALITKHTVDFIKQNRDKPFFIYVAQEAVHEPYQGPGDPPQRDSNGKKLKGPRRSIKDSYRDMMTEMDKSLGRIRDTLRETGLAENTIIFFFSDNGATKEGSNAPLRGFKGDMYEGGHREPAIAWWPGHIKPGVSHDLAISIDLMPTFLDLAGIAAPADRPLDGVSLKNLLLENKPLGARKLYWNGLAMRDGPWKLIMEQGRPQLYNLDNDLSEANDISGEHPDRVRAMIADLDAWKKDVATNATPQPKNRAGLGAYP
ncbi:MAG: sulfatase-like hydrolase/transferase [Opitutaceae bacterium]|jgi:arylsulfatase A-like enzyme|nr:sulfatase-like hydrolase/transferase [Opitutaceae bacterium]